MLPLPLEEGAACQVLLQQKIAQSGSMGLPKAGSHVGLLDVSMWAMGCQRGMQGDILPARLKEGISWALTVGLCPPGLPGSCWCSGE